MKRYGMIVLYKNIGDTMESRMNRYQTKKSNDVHSRTLRNQKVYEELYTNSAYTNFSRVDAQAIDLSELNNTNMGRRESYHRTKGAQSFGIEDTSDTTKIRDYSYFYPDTSKKSPKDFDINHVLQEAKRNREDGDEDLEKKRKLKTTEYNILTDLTQAKMKELKQKASKVDVLSNKEEENLENLINTITSKTMTHDINQILEQEKIKKQEQESQKDSLLDDLMPTNIDETLISSDILNQVQEQTIETNMIDNDQTKTEIKTVIDESFYTKSMDLSSDDLIQAEDESEEDELFIEEPSKKSRIFKIIVFAIIIFLIVEIAFIVYQYLH